MSVEREGQHGEPEGLCSLLPCLGAENWSVLSPGPTAIPSSTPTSHWDSLLHCCVTSGWRFTSLTTPRPRKANNSASSHPAPSLGGLKEREGGACGASPWASGTQPPRRVISNAASSFCRASQEAIQAARIRSKKLNAGAQKSALTVPVLRAQRAREPASWLGSHSPAAGGWGFWWPSRLHSSQHCWEGLLLGRTEGKRGGGGG